MPSPDYEIFHSIEYKPDLSLHLIRPSTAKVAPLVIFVHGGGWRQGSNDEQWKLFLGMAKAGFACASISYTFSQVAPFPRAIEDVRAAIRFLRAKADDYGLDASRFAGMGCSAGGHLISLAATAGEEAGFDVGDHLDMPTTLKAVVNVCGPTDMVTSLDHHPADDETVSGPAYHNFLAGDPASIKDRAKLASALHHLSSDCPPFLVVHGQQDTIVRHTQSEAFVAAIKEQGGSAELMSFPESCHDVLYPNYDTVVPAVLEFFKRHI